MAVGMTTSFLMWKDCLTVHEMLVQIGYYNSTFTILSNWYIYDDVLTFPVRSDT